jgi:hypothetical protein
VAAVAAAAAAAAAAVVAAAAAAAARPVDRTGGRGLEVKRFLTASIVTDGKK